MDKPSVILNYQVMDELDSSSIPCQKTLQNYSQAVANFLSLGQIEFTVRITNDQEMEQLNQAYRDQSKSTNVLSFPFEAIPVDISNQITEYEEAQSEPNYLGDLVISHPYLIRESTKDNKALLHHYAHMVIHGMLHLLGHDHIEDEPAQQMESLEIAILKTLHINNPYQ